MEQESFDEIADQVLSIHCAIATNKIMLNNINREIERLKDELNRVYLEMISKQGLNN